VHWVCTADSLTLNRHYGVMTLIGLACSEEGVEMTEKPLYERLGGVFAIAAVTSGLEVHANSLVCNIAGRPFEYVGTEPGTQSSAWKKLITSFGSLGRNSTKWP
jgi:hypothetical protein